MSFLKRGSAAVEAVARADAQTEARKDAASQFKIKRFWMKNDTETRITFLDGTLTSDNLLDTVIYNEHQVNKDGHWRNWFPCTEDVDNSEPCPICEQGDGYRPSLVAVFTVIDHSVWKDNKGSTHQYQKQLYVCKREAFKLLQKLAVKRGGLEGCTFDVMRSGERSLSAGNNFDFCEKETLLEIKDKYSLEDVSPIDYDEAIPYLSPAKLQALGFGASGSATPGTGNNSKTHKAPTNPVNYDSDI